MPMNSTDADLTWRLFAFNDRLRWMAKRGNEIRGGIVRNAATVQRIGTWAEEHNFNAYVALNPDDSNRTRVSAQNITQRRWIVLDYDKVEQTLPIGNFDITPPWWDSAIEVYTGNGIQYLIQFASPVLFPPHDKADDTARVGRWLREAQKLWPLPNAIIDTHCCDLPRVVRMPGTIHQKTGCRSSAYVPPSAGMWEPLYDEIYAWTPPPQEPRTLPTGLERSLVNLWPFLNVTVRKFLNEGTPYPGRHDACFTCVKTLHELGADREDVVRWASLGALKCTPTALEPEYVDYCVRRIYR